jgi:hypothetical protein
MMNIEAAKEEWTAASANTNNIMAAIEKLTNSDYAILSLVCAYGKECRNMENALLGAGLHSDEEMIGLCVDSLQEAKKLEAVK